MQNEHVHEHRLSHLDERPAPACFSQSALSLRLEGPWTSYPTYAQPAGVSSPVRWRRPILTQEVHRLYNAISFLNFAHGEVFDTHIVLAFSAMGFQDHRTPMALLSQWNQAAARWLAVGPNKPRARWKQRAKSGGATKHRWAFVVENARDMGFHVHELCIVPRAQIAAFEAYARKWWSAAAGRSLPREAIFVRRPNLRSRERAYRLQTLWFRYLSKTLGPHVGTPDANGIRRNGRELFGLKRPFVEGPPVATARLSGICRALSRSAQVEAGFVSRWDEGRFEELFCQWEFAAGEAWREERAAQQRMAEILPSLAIGWHT